MAIRYAPPPPSPPAFRKHAIPEHHNLFDEFPKGAFHSTPSFCCQSPLVVSRWCGETRLHHCLCTYAAETPSVALSFLMSCFLHPNTIMKPCPSHDGNMFKVIRGMMSLDTSVAMERFETWSCRAFPNRTVASLPKAYSTEMLLNTYITTAIDLYMDSFFFFFLCHDAHQPNQQSSLCFSTAGMLNDISTRCGGTIGVTFHDLYPSPAG